jgi:hypothetical protein
VSAAPASLGSSLLSLVTAAAPSSAAAAEARNVTLWARGEDPAKLSISERPPEYAIGGLQGEDSLPPRVCAIVGPRATIKGVAAVLKPYVDRVTSPNPTLDLESLARALLVYNLQYLGGTLSAWKVGLRLTLPLEIDLGPDPKNPDVKGLFTDRQALAIFAGQFNTAWSSLLDKPAADITIPDPAAVRSDAVTEAAKSPAALKNDLFAPLMTNPYESCFRVVEVLRQLRIPADDGRRLRFLIALFETGFGREQAIMLAATTGGHGVLRCIWNALSAADATTLSAQDRVTYDYAVTSVAAGLGLTPDGAGGFKSPSDVRPEIEPIEPPLTSTQLDGGKGGQVSFQSPPTSETAGGRRQLVLGRNLTIGVPGKTTDKHGRTWKGYSYNGRLDPDLFRSNHADAIGTGGATDPKLAACLDVAIAIAPNEGWLDAANMSDTGMLSIGLQQWSIHVDDEGTVLLARFKDHEPEQWELFFGTYGLDVRLSGTNPAADLGVVAPFGRYFPHQATFWGAVNGGDPLAALPVPVPPKTIAPGEDLVDFFSDTPAKSATTTFDDEWCGRVRIAALCSIDFCAVQLETAAYRFKRFEGRGVTVEGVAHKLDTLFSSEFGAAIVLDHSINEPGDMAPAMKRALDPRLKGVPAHATGTTDLLPEWETRFAIDYMGERRLSDKARRDDWILRQHDQGPWPAYPGLAPEPGSFGGWP